MVADSRPCGSASQRSGRPGAVPGSGFAVAAGAVEIARAEDVSGQRHRRNLHEGRGAAAGCRTLFRWRRLRCAGRLQELLQADSDPAHSRDDRRARRRDRRLRRRLRGDRRGEEGGRHRRGGRHHRARMRRHRRLETPAPDRCGRGFYRSQLSLPGRTAGSPVSTEPARRGMTGPSKYEIFDRSRLRIQPLSRRQNDLSIGHWLALEDATSPFEHPDLAMVGARLEAARGNRASRILIMGAHVLRAGVNRHLIDLMERGWITHVSMNGAGAIHDYELARIGATTESVARYVKSGEFGLWQETGDLNDWIAEAAREGLGLGENVGRRIQQSDYPHRDLSVFAAAWRFHIPVTVHAGIGYDILHEHPNCDGAALGAASYRDFLIFTRAVENLEGGVLLNFGSAIMGPEG